MPGASPPDVKMPTHLFASIIVPPVISRFRIRPPAAGTVRNACLGSASGHRKSSNNYRTAYPMPDFSQSGPLYPSRSAAITRSRKYRPSSDGRRCRPRHHDRPVQGLLSGLSPEPNTTQTGLPLRLQRQAGPNAFSFVLPATEHDRQSDRDQNRRNGDLV